MVAILVLPVFMALARISNPDHDVPNQAYEHFEWIFILFSAILLALSAYYLSSNIKKLTGKSQNTCLLVWHIVNVFLMAVFYLAIGVLSLMVYKGSYNDEALQYY